MKQKLTDLKGKIHNSIIRIGAFNILYSIMDKTMRHKINTEVGMNNTMKQLEQISIEHSTQTINIYIPVQSTRNILQDRPFVRPLRSLNKFRGTETKQIMFPDNTGIRNH